MSRFEGLQLRQLSGQTPVNAGESLMRGDESQLVLVKSHKSRIWGSLKLAFVFLISIGTGIALKTMSVVWRENIDPLDYRSRTDRVLSETPLIDGHNDLPFLVRLQLNNQIYEGNFPFGQSLGSHTDLKRMRQGQLGGQFWSIFVECPRIVHMDDPNHSVRDTLEQADVAKRLFAEYSDLQYCETSARARQAFKAHKIPSTLGAEGLHQVGSSIAVIRQLYELGVRYITITHNCDNAFATAASTVTETGKDHGLSDFGRAAIKEMNRLGMMVDLSHTSHRTMRDVLAVTKAPVIFSHSGCYAIGNDYRNAPDDVLKMLKQNGGLIMIFFAKKFIRPDNPGKANLDDVVDHIFHAVSVAGWDHVGIGSDFDGTGSIASGIDDVSAYPKLIEAVMRRGASDEQVRKLSGENILRVWRQNEMVSAEMQKWNAEKPVESFWEGRAQPTWDGSLPTLKADPGLR